MKPSLVLDCQTTGATPEHGSLLEIAWLRLDADGAPGPIESYLCRTSDEIEVARRITKITGITEEDVRQLGVDEETVWRALEKEICTLAKNGPAKLIVHYAPFEKRFITDLAERYGDGHLPFEFVCTHAIAKRLLANLPGHSLRALAGYFGCSVDEFRRSEDHVRGTVTIWQSLLAMLKSQGIESFAQIEAFTRKRAPKRSTTEFPLDRETIKRLPKKPGVYSFLGKDGRTLYVGKATDLRSRVSSYFRQKGYRTSSTLEMLSQTFDVQVQETDTPLEAALLEAREIRSIGPMYNRALRSADSKIYSLSPEQTVIEEPPPPGATGPFTSSRGVQALLSLLQLWNDPPSLEDMHPQICAALGLDYPKPPEPSMLLEAFERLKGFYPGSGDPLSGLLSFGGMLWFYLKDRESIDDEELDDEAAPAPADDESEELPPWTPERLMRHLAWSIVSVSRTLRRMRWLELLSLAALRYTFQKRTHVLPPLGGGTINNRREYDVLSVLNAEIKRLIRTGHLLSLEFDGGKMLSADEAESIQEWF